LGSTSTVKPAAAFPVQDTFMNGGGGPDVKHAHDGAWTQAAGSGSH
jgi:hypothetical protein